VKTSDGSLAAPTEKTAIPDLIETLPGLKRSPSWQICLIHATPEQLAVLERLLVSENPGAGLVAIPAAAGRTRHFFRLSGSHWDVVLDGGEPFHLENTLGAKYLHYLLHHPGETISAFDLEVAICPEKRAARSMNSIPETRDPLMVKNYLRELTELRCERQQAQDRGDEAQVGQLDGEIETIKNALQLGEKPGNPAERARNNVRKAVAVVRRRLRLGSKAEKEFGRHIEQFVSLGYECTYCQPKGEIWG
jgi:hypothetical protein